MNERIKELYKQSCRDSEGYMGNPFDPDKFAELIVRECAKVCDDIDSEYEGEDVLATWCAKAIKEHFGVE
jgi:hypothetical protein